MNADEIIEGEATEELTAERLKELRVKGIRSIGTRITSIGIQLVELSNSNDPVELSHIILDCAITLDAVGDLLTKAAEAVLKEIILEEIEKNR